MTDKAIIVAAILNSHPQIKKYVNNSHASYGLFESVVYGIDKFFNESKWQ